MKDLSQNLSGIYIKISDFTQRRNVESQHEFNFSAATVLEEITLWVLGSSVIQLRLKNVKYLMSC
jgi:hypothetical protein